MTSEIPYNAPYGRVKNSIDKLTTIGTITLSMSSATVCGMTTVGASLVPTLTTINFVDQTGPMPPAKVTAQNNLLLNGDEPLLFMVTRFLLKCPDMNRLGVVGVPDQSHGGVQFLYDGQASAFVDWSSSVLEVEGYLRNFTALRHDSDFGHVNVTAALTSGADGAICEQGQVVNTTIDFRSLWGNLYELDIVDTMEFGNQLSNWTMIGPKATTKNLVCSNRGICDHATGNCDCFFDTGNKFTTNSRMGSSNGAAQTGTRGDCGFRVIPQRKCAGGLADAEDEESWKPCTGNGFCDNSTYVCQCSEGFEGPDCSARTCPSGKAWFDMPKGDGYAHQTDVVCSGRGGCDGINGYCICQIGFAGEACDQLACGDADNEGCGQKGKCLSMSQLGDVAVVNGEWTKLRYGDPDPRLNGKDTWDRDMIHGCSCDGGNVEVNFNGPSSTYVSGISVDSPMTLGSEGYACHKYACPYGDDPDSPGVNEQQKVTCSLTAGTFALTFRDQTTTAINFNDAVGDIKAALEALSTVSAVTVALVATGTAVCGAGPLGFTVDFTGETGNVPALRVSDASSLTVTEEVAGTKEFLECSNRGLCNSEAGLLQGTCTCDFGYKSSDGNGVQGTKRDCGFYDMWALPASIHK